MKKLIGSLIATAMTMGMVGGTSANAERILTTETTTSISTVEATKTTAEPSVIRRGSYSYTVTNNLSYEESYQYTFIAESDGHIHIDLYCLYGSNHHADIIGKIAYNDSMISSIGDGGSTFNNHGYTNNVVSYDGDNVVYATVCNNSTTYSGRLYATYDLYVKESYLTTEQTIYFWDTPFTIPFGEPMVDYQSQIANLTTEIEILKEENSHLLNALYSQKNRAYGDMNDDGFVDARDASLLLTLYARQSVGDPITLDQLIEEQKVQ